MDLRVLLIHGGCSGGCRHETMFAGVEPTIGIFVAHTPEEIQQQPLPALILLDLDLTLAPTALEVLEWLRSQKTYGQIPVIALVSGESADCVGRAYELGANACVMKSEDGGLLDEVARGISSYAKALHAALPNRWVGRRAAAAKARF